MSKNLKTALILLVCIAVSACTTEVSLNRDLVHQEKIDSVYVNQMVQNISIELADSSLTTKDFENIQLSTNVMSANLILKNALTHHLVGNAFSYDLLVNLGSNENKKRYLTPVLTPSITMSSDYAVVDISLKASMTQKLPNNEQSQYEGLYSSKQVIDSGALTSSKEANIQYWIDNPVVLREKIVNGLYEVSEQFAEDFNGQ